MLCKLGAQPWEGLAGKSLLCEPTGLLSFGRNSFSKHFWFVPPGEPGGTLESEFGAPGCRLFFPPVRRICTAMWQSRTLAARLLLVMAVAAHALGSASASAALAAVVLQHEQPLMPEPLNPSDMEAPALSWHWEVMHGMTALAAGGGYGISLVEPCKLHSPCASVQMQIAGRADPVYTWAWLGNNGAAREGIAAGGAALFVLDGCRPGTRHPPS